MLECVSPAESHASTTKLLISWPTAREGRKVL
jgi:hypothetical protein